MSETYTTAFKVQVAIEALKERETIEELSARFGVPPALILSWKDTITNGAEQVFSKPESGSNWRKQQEKLKKKINQLEMEHAFLKKNMDKL